MIPWKQRLGLLGLRSQSSSNADIIPPAKKTSPLPLLHQTLKRVRVAVSSAGIMLAPFEEEAENGYVGASVLVDWDASVSTQEWNESESKYQHEPTVVVCGVAGILKGFRDSYLILITKSETVATLLNNPFKNIQSVQDLIALPLDQSKAYAMILELQMNRMARNLSISSTSSASTESAIPEADTSTISFPSQLKNNAQPNPLLGETLKPIAPVQPTVTRSTVSSSGVELDPHSFIANANLAAGLNDQSNVSSKIDTETETSQRALDEKIVRETLRDLKGMYWSTAVDITHSLQKKNGNRNMEDDSMPTRERPIGMTKGIDEFLIEPNLHIPLWRRVDKRFWYNAHLSSPFVRAGLHRYVIALVQGCVRSATLELTGDLTSDSLAPSGVELTMTVISRRGIERAGLRYQRRGVNSEGGVANFVETEFIIEAIRQGKLHVCSFVLTRGSIPLFWSQSPWALKPPPVLERTEKESQEALTKHFEKQKNLYGSQVVVNLAEGSGKEGPLVAAYAKGVESLEDPEVKYMQWDFHHETKGMRYENISKLLTLLEEDLNELKCFWYTESGVLATQNGVVRVNCIDCLDRTNVVQSAIARWILHQHLVRLGFSTRSEDGMYTELDAAFNEIWADNGDAISREYAGTSALKGDFTRTGKRNLRGALNDATNSLARLLQSTVSDFFKQATIDYVLGNNLNVFAEFQSRLETSDPGEILRIVQIRGEAIETCTQSLLENEVKVDAWTLLSPRDMDVVRHKMFEEKVLLVSNKAIYVVSYEYTLQKVMSFIRIPTGDVVSVKKGPYVFSALDSAARDTEENYGFILYFHSASTTERAESYSMKVKTSPFENSNNSKSLANSISASLHLNSAKNTADILDKDQDVHFIAFKALRKEMVSRRNTADEEGNLFLDNSGHSISDYMAKDVASKTGKNVVDDVIGVLKDECEKAGAIEDLDSWVQEGDIIGLSEAEASTTIFERLGHNIKTFIWL